MNHTLTSRNRQGLLRGLRCAAVALAAGCASLAGASPIEGAEAAITPPHLPGASYGLGAEPATAAEAQVPSLIMERQAYARNAEALFGLAAAEPGMRPTAAALWYGYVRIDPSLPQRLQRMLGKPESAMTLELRRGPGLVSQLGVGSIVRWQAGPGQLALRLRGGKLGLQYRMRFDL